MPTYVNIGISSLEEALTEVISLDVGKTLYVWFDFNREIWRVTDWNALDEDAAKGTFLAVRPTADVSKWRKE